MTVLQFTPQLRIVCPICKRKQSMRKDTISKIWYPITPYCCDAMTLDSPEWNALLDKLIKEEQWIT